MATWKNTLITQLGLNLQAKLQGGGQLLLTRAVAGSNYVNPDALLRQTEILNIKQTLTFSSIVSKSDGKAELPVMLTNRNLTEAYTLQQVGVYASDPELGEILYFIAQAEEPDTIPTESELKDFVINFTFYLIFGNASKIDVTYEPAQLMTKADFDHLLCQVVRPCAHVRNGTVHELTLMEGEAPDAYVIRFKAVASFIEGDSFSLNGQSVDASTVDGEILHAGDFISGQEIVASVHDKRIIFPWRSYFVNVSANTAARHTHPNKNILDKLTQAMLDIIESAHTHIGDAVKHITAAERTSWNDANSKKHTHSNKGVLDKITQALFDAWNGKADKTAVEAAMQTKANGNWSTYTSWGEIGCTGSESVQEIFEAIPVRSELIVLINSGANPVYPSTVGTLHIARVHTFRETALFSDTYGNRWTAETKSGESSVLFVKWVPLATGTPPEEHDLQLAAGWSVDARCVYWRNQFGEISIFVSAKATAQMSLRAILATLPTGFRPSAPKLFVAVAATPDGSRNGGNTVNIATTGVMTYFGVDLPVGSLLIVSGTFVAAS